MEKLYMVHGFMGTGETHFNQQIEYFNEKYEVVALDLPGHGTNGTQYENDYFQQTLEWLRDYIEEHGAGFILGLSLGASLAIHTAIRFPSLVKGVVLTGYIPFVPDYLQPLMEKQYDQFLHIENHAPDTADHFENLHGEKWKQTLRSVLYMMTFEYPAISDQQLLQVENILLLNGDQERHEVEATTYLKQLNDEISVGVIPGAGHTANMDSPQVFNRNVEGWLQLHV
ncbi:alpha/beta fold hydrolase [Halobacillus locisalis]|uniref:Alpha/beta fold hydrolase n=1 Tax=Halobacillus locisalis TaxID=220753 RepID=A0A838CX14_9BACI|nr:alpha/beta fold hydrolase [Halobacillus locisalis]MBA2176587.1 alpha/beta fold hydrolase [Halobacillus locisalis]